MIEAKGHYLESLDLRRELVSLPDNTQPDAADNDQRDLARTLAFLAGLYLDLGMQTEADDAYWKAHVIREELYSKNLRDYDSKFQFARSWNNFGKYQTRQRNLGTALYFFRESEKLRESLNQRQPDNKEYVLEYTSVLTRIAELELFFSEHEPDVAKSLAPTEPLKNAEISSEQEPHVTKQVVQSKAQVKALDRADDALSTCSDLLTGLRSDLLDDTRMDWETGTRLASYLAECRALQARSAMIRLDLAPETGAKDEALVKVRAELLEKARTVVRAAMDEYSKVEERLRDRGEKLTEDELYHYAASRFLSAEIHRKKKPNENEVLDKWNSETAELLKLAIRDFCRLDRGEISRDRAFRSVAGQDWFKHLYDKPAAAPGSELAPAKPQPTPAKPLSAKTSGG